MVYFLVEESQGHEDVSVSLHLKQRWRFGTKSVSGNCSVKSP